MKFKLLITAFTASVLMSACATLGDNAPPLTVDALITRAKAGESTESLLASLRASRERFTLSGSEYAKLKERGLPDAVLDELQKRETAAIHDDAWRIHSPWLRPWPYYAYRPIVIVRPSPKQP